MNTNKNAQETTENPLSDIQRRGMDSLGLSIANVRTENFGAHTIEGIQNLLESNRAQNNREAFRMIEGLDAVQTEGILAGLSRENVNTENFGEHTLLGIDNLKFRDETLTTEQAFDTLAGLDPNQVNGVITFQLPVEFVQTENFGNHTLEGIRTLRNNNENISNQEAFEQIAGLNKEQTMGVTDLSLTREQVQHPVYSKNIFKTIKALKEMNPQATTKSAYDYALQMPEYQSRAIANFGFTPEQMGVIPVGSRFDQQQTANQSIASGSTVDAAAFLMEEYMSPAEARTTAYELNTTQVVGMVDMGLSLDQVKSDFFRSAERVLDSVFDELQNAKGEIELPLSGDNRKTSREILARFILEATTKEALQGHSLADDISVMSDASMVQENIEPLDVLKPLEGEDINEFIKYTSSLQELDILDTIKHKIRENEQKGEATLNMGSPQKSSPEKNTVYNDKPFDLSAFKTPASPNSPERNIRKEEKDKNTKTPLSPQKNNEKSSERKPKRRKL